MHHRARRVHVCVMACARSAGDQNLHEVAELWELGILMSSWITRRGRTLGSRRAAARGCRRLHTAP